MSGSIRAKPVSSSTRCTGRSPSLSPCRPRRWMRLPISSTQEYSRRKRDKRRAADRPVGCANSIALQIARFREGGRVCAPHKRDEELGQVSERRLHDAGGRGADAPCGVRKLRRVLKPDRFAARSTCPDWAPLFPRNEGSAKLTSPEMPIQPRHDRSSHRYFQDRREAPGYGNPDRTRRPLLEEGTKRGPRT
jgi:hypothetical protein